MTLASKIHPQDRRRSAELATISEKIVQLKKQLDHCHMLVLVRLSKDGRESRSRMEMKPIKRSEWALFQASMRLLDATRNSDCFNNQNQTNER